MHGQLTQFRQKAKPTVQPGHEPISRANYNARALKFYQTSGLSEAPTIQPETPEFNAWLRYFDDHLGWRPYALRLFIDGRAKAFTVPTQWPEWFDTSFAGSED
jgi:hypothetical protein